MDYVARLPANKETQRFFEMVIQKRITLPVVEKDGCLSPELTVPIQSSDALGTIYSPTNVSLTINFTTSSNASSEGRPA